MKYCEKCGEMLEDNAAFCSRCGKAQQERRYYAPRRTSKGVTTLIMVISTVVIVLYVLAFIILPIALFVWSLYSVRGIV